MPPINPDEHIGEKELVVVDGVAVEPVPQLAADAVEANDNKIPEEEVADDYDLYLPTPADGEDFADREDDLRAWVARNPITHDPLPHRRIEVEYIIPDQNTRFLNEDTRQLALFDYVYPNGGKPKDFEVAHQCKTVNELLCRLFPDVEIQDEFTFEELLELEETKEHKPSKYQAESAQSDRELIEKELENGDLDPALLMKFFLNRCRLKVKDPERFRSYLANNSAIKQFLPAVIEKMLRTGHLPSKEFDDFIYSTPYDFNNSHCPEYPCCMVKGGVIVSISKEDLSAPNYILEQYQCYKFPEDLTGDQIKFLDDHGVDPEEEIEIIGFNYNCEECVIVQSVDSEVLLACTPGDFDTENNILRVNIA